MHNAFMAGDLDKAGRLKWARETCGVAAMAENATEAARLMDVPAGTYLSHENGYRGFTNASAKKYAAMYRVNLFWLITGEGQARSKAA